MSNGDFAPESKPEPTPPAIISESTAEETLLPPPRFQTGLYVSDGGSLPLGWALALAGGGLAAALFVGSFAGFIWPLPYLVVFFPIFIGLALGGAGMAIIIKAGELRNPRMASTLAGIVAGLSGVMAMGAIHYYNYRLTLDNIEEAFGKVDINFAEYIDRRAKRGPILNRAGLSLAPEVQRDKRMRPGYVGSFIYWLVEMAVVAGIAWTMMRKAIAAPSCVRCNRWKTERPVAMVTVSAENLAVQAILEGDVMKLLSCAGPIKSQGLLLKTAVCPHCGVDGEVDICLEKVTKGAYGQQQTITLMRVIYPGEVLHYLDGARS